jgi:hypothetical protein
MPGRQAPEHDPKQLEKEPLHLARRKPTALIGCSPKPDWPSIRKPT